MNKVPVAFCFIAFLLSCRGGETEMKKEAPEDYYSYWHQGKAELTSYDLTQARYGEIREGHAVLIFVTEDFSASKQVKLDHPEKLPEDVIPVMKLNFTKKFNTGIYPYSIMSSVFTPVEREKFPKTVKLSTSVQEWCGHVFFQLNLRGEEYLLQNHSYFESDFEGEMNLGNLVLEDELWTLIRLNPKVLPVGDVELFPSSVFLRLKHIELKAYPAKAGLKELKNDMEYLIEYPDLERRLLIRFKKEFPHEIESWEETYFSGFGSDKTKLTSSGIKRERLLLDYWNKNKNSDLFYRKELGLKE